MPPASAATAPSHTCATALIVTPSLVFSANRVNNSSYLKVYASLLALDKKPNGPKVKVEMPPCSEEVAIADDTVFVLFESASAKYFEGTDGMGKSPALALPVSALPECW